ncbi:Ubiquitin-protein ligase, partial [Perkinsus chesapeaki]
VTSARVTPEKWEEYLVEPQCCLNQLANVLDHADAGMQARAAETWKGMLNNMMRVYSNGASSPASSPPSSSARAAATSSTMGRILDRFRSNSRVGNGPEESRSNTGEESGKVSSRVVGVAMERLVGEDGERLRQIVERAEQELDHPSSSSTSSGVVTDLLACMASVASCSDKLAGMMMEKDTTGRLLGKLLGNGGGGVGEELGRQALRTATSLLPAVKFMPPKSGEKKIDANKIMRLSGEQACSDSGSGTSVRSVPRQLLVKLMTGAVASTAGEPQNSMQLLLAGSMYARHRGWNLAASQPELVDGIVSSVADILAQQCSAPRYSPSLIVACIHTVLCITPKGKNVVQAVQELVYRHGLIRSLKEIQSWRDDSDDASSPVGADAAFRCGGEQQKQSMSRSSSLLGGLRRSSRSSLSSIGDEEAVAVETEVQPVGWLPLMNAEASQALRVLDRGMESAGGLAGKLALSRSGEMNLNGFTKLAESSTPPTPYELLQSGMLINMCDFVASGQEADGVRMVLAENPAFYEHLVKCLVSAIDRHQLLTLALDPGRETVLCAAISACVRGKGGLADGVELDVSAARESRDVGDAAAS